MRDPRVGQVFANFDLDGSGTIWASELHNVLTSMGNHMSLADAALVSAELDANQDGGIDLWELCAYLVKRHDQLQTDRSEQWAVDQAFTSGIFDADEHGAVTVRSLSQVFRMEMGGSVSGLTAAEFESLLSDIGVRAGAPDDTRVPLEQLRSHPAFSEDSGRPTGLLSQILASEIANAPAPAPAEGARMPRMRSSLGF